MRLLERKRKSRTRGPQNPKKMDKQYYVYIMASRKNGTVYIGVFGDPENAINTEKRLKNYKRKWKIDLIEKDNQEWKDLYEDIIPGFCG